MGSKDDKLLIFSTENDKYLLSEQEEYQGLPETLEMHSMN